ncbi:MAG TPA: AAA family ATPase [Povalibacter sp.]|uniref:AAA family ATPase n=1 Tax=Povalibacter sp. TaxID=1962978 RepID=UPI002C6A1F03|nr:AAA family ATPase [Povalibacter sp.]HMN45569.1 AAA family ATPase [Povalibacter sp.]
MKIRKLRIENVTSYKESTEFIFDKGVNILIGTNGGGKTNLQKILALTLTKYFIHQYDFHHDDNRTGIDLVDIYNDRLTRRMFPKHSGEDGPQRIYIELIPEQQDIDNIRAIGTNLAALNDQLDYWERRYESYAPLTRVDQIAASEFFSYRIDDLVLQQPVETEPAWAFLEYLRTFFIFHRVATAVPGMKLTSPVFFFSSERAAERNFTVQAGQLNEQSYFQGMRTTYNAATGQSVNLMQWGAQHFVRLFRKASREASRSRGKIVTEVFEAMTDVQVLSRYLRQMGYRWDFGSDVDELQYQFTLLKNGRQITPDMFSSGEREIVHFLLALFALNVRGGLVLVDEPELLLHPRWQRIFLGLFRDLAPERQSQFIVSTHSPTFVTPETIDSITRVFRGSSGGTRRVALRDVNLPNKASLVRMINSHNNERLFFADKVVLVEGISDRLVIGSLLDYLARLVGDSSAVEVIEVGGKGNFSDYRTVLAGLETPTYTIADRDYLNEIGANGVGALFEESYDKQWDVLTGGKSMDRSTLVGNLRNAVTSGNLEELRKFYDYLSARLVRLKATLTDADRALLVNERNRLAIENVFTLRAGDIEDYLPDGVRTVNAIVEMTRNRHWVNSVPDAARREELGEIGCAVLGVSDEVRGEILGKFRAATIQFPEALVSVATQPSAAGGVETVRPA